MHQMRLRTEDGVGDIRRGRHAPPSLDDAVFEMRRHEDAFGGIEERGRLPVDRHVHVTMY